MKTLRSLKKHLSNPYIPGQILLKNLCDGDNPTLRAIEETSSEPLTLEEALMIYQGVSQGGIEV